MLDVALVIAGIGVVVFLSHFFAWGASFTSIPDSLLLLIIGIVLGPITGVLSTDFFGQIGELLLTIALVVLLFESGTRMDIRRVGSLLLPAWRLALTSWLLVFLVIGIGLWAATDWSLLMSLILAAAIGGTTSTVVIPLLGRLKVRESVQAKLVLESAFSDVLSIVVAITLIGALEGQALSLSSVSLRVTGALIGAIVVGIVGGSIWSLLLDQVRHMRNSMFATPAIVFVLYGVTELIGLSGPIAALIFGIVLGASGTVNSYLSGKHRLLSWIVKPTSLSRRERAFFAEIVFLLQTFFFVFVGVAIPLTSSSALITGFIVTVILLILRGLAISASGHQMTDRREAVLMNVIVPRGLAAAVLAELLVTSGAVGAEIVRNVAYTTVLWSIAISSLLVFLVEKTNIENWWPVWHGGELNSNYARATRSRNSQIGSRQNITGEINPPS